MFIAFQIVAIVFMFILAFIGIWGLITINKIFGQIRYKNYILEKLTQNLHMLILPSNDANDANDANDEFKK